MTLLAEKITSSERVRVVPLAAPMLGVVRVGEVPKTATPVPVSSEREDNKAAEVMLAAAVV